MGLNFDWDYFKKYTLDVYYQYAEDKGRYFRPTDYDTIRCTGVYNFECEGKERMSALKITRDGVIKYIDLSQLWDIKTMFQMDVKREFCSLIADTFENWDNL